MGPANSAQNIPVNNILNRIDGWNDKNSGLLKKVAGSRLANLFVTGPIELTAVAGNILKTPFIAASSVMKTVIKPVALITGSQAIKNYEAKLPGFVDLLKSIARIVAQTIGAALSLTLGVMSPRANFRLHCALGLATNRKQEAVKAALAEKEAEAKLQKELAAKLEQEKAAQSQLTKEQAALNLLAETYKAAEQIEEETANIEEEPAKIEEETANTEYPIEKTVELAAENISSEINEPENTFTTVIDESLSTLQETSEDAIDADLPLEEEEGDVEVDSPYEFVFVEQYEESYIENVLASAVGRSKDAVKNAVNVIANPVASTSNAYNYVSNLFAKKA